MYNTQLRILPIGETYAVDIPIKMLGLVSKDIVLHFHTIYVNSRKKIAAHFSICSTSGDFVPHTSNLCSALDSTYVPIDSSHHVQITMLKKVRTLPGPLYKTAEVISVAGCLA